MLIDIMRDAYLSRNAGKTTSEHIAVFTSLLRIRLKRCFADKNDMECRARFLNYDVRGYSYLNLDCLFRDLFISREYYFETGTQEPVILDCGSNIGMSVLYFKHIFPKAKIIAFEANPNAYRLLRANVEANNIDNVEMHNVALSDHDGEISFFISSDPGTTLGSVRTERGGAVELKVHAGRLSRYLDRNSKIDLVKMDVEGSEQLIVDELIRSACLQMANQYIVEYHHRINNDRSILSEFLRKFEQNGYDYNVKAHFRKPGGVQDVLLHFYKSI